MSGFGVESVFQKVKLSCKQFEDTALQLAILLHDRSRANENFLLSFRNCVVTLPDHHPLKIWSQRKKPEIEKDIQTIHKLLLEDLRFIWAADHGITPKERTLLLGFLRSLDGKPPYLDLSLFKMAGMIKIGNVAKAEDMIRQLINFPPFELIEQTPIRRDPVEILAREKLSELLKTIRAGLQDNVLFQMLLLYLQEFFTDDDLLAIVQNELELTPKDALESLQLRYHRQGIQQFSDYMVNAYQEGKRHERFLQRFISERLEAQRLWIFLGRYPVEPSLREPIAKAMLKSADPLLLNLLASDSEWGRVLEGMSEDFRKQSIPRRRQYFRQRLAINSKDAVALYELIRMGDTGEWIVEEISKNP